MARGESNHDTLTRRDLGSMNKCRFVSASLWSDSSSGIKCVWDVSIKLQCFMFENIIVCGPNFSPLYEWLFN